MNEFLDQVWFDNTIRSYLIVTAVILFVIIIKRYLARYLAASIFFLLKKVWKNLDRKTFINLVAKPLGFFLAVFVAVITLHKLVFPSALDFDIYSITLKEIFHSFGSLVIIFSFIRLLLRAIDFIALILHEKAELTADVTDNQLVVFFKDFFKVIVAIIGLLMVLKFAFGFNIGNLLTGLSIVGAAIALALRESLENLIASFIIFFDKPFATGDVVKVHAFTGTVEKIGLRSTRIRTEQKTFITVPNKQMVDSILDNLSLRTQRKGELRLELGLNTSSDKLDQLVEGIRNITTRNEVENSTVLLNDIAHNSFVITVDYFTGPITQDEFNKVKEEINFSVLRLIENLKIAIAGRSTDIHVTAMG